MAAGVYELLARAHGELPPRDVVPHSWEAIREDMHRLRAKYPALAAETRSREGREHPSTPEKNQ